MKKVFTFCFFAFALLLGTKTAFAQSNSEMKKQAYAQVKELRTHIKLNNTDLEQIYNAQLNYNKKLASINDHLTSGTKEYTAAVNTLTYTLQTKVKEIIGKGLFEKYLSLKGEKEIEQ